MTDITTSAPCEMPDKVGGHGPSDRPPYSSIVDLGETDLRFFGVSEAIGQALVLPFKYALRLGALLIPLIVAGFFLPAITIEDALRIGTFGPGFSDLWPFLVSWT